MRSHTAFLLLTEGYANGVASGAAAAGAPEGAYVLPHGQPDLSMAMVR